MMSVCSKRATLQEKNMSGCLAQPVQMRTVIGEDMSFDKAVDETTDVRTSLYKLCNRWGKRTYFGYEVLYS